MTLLVQAVRWTMKVWERRQNVQPLDTLIACVLLYHKYSISRLKILNFTKHGSHLSYSPPTVAPQLHPASRPCLFRKMPVVLAGPPRLRLGLARARVAAVAAVAAVDLSRRDSSDRLKTTRGRTEARRSMDTDCPGTCCRKPDRLTCYCVGPRCSRRDDTSTAVMDCAAMQAIIVMPRKTKSVLGPVSRAMPWQKLQRFDHDIEHSQVNLWITLTRPQSSSDCCIPSYLALYIIVSLPSITVKVTNEIKPRST